MVEWIKSIPTEKNLHQISKNNMEKEGDLSKTQKEDGKFDKICVITGFVQWLLLLVDGFKERMSYKIPFMAQKTLTCGVLNNDILFSYSFLFLQTEEKSFANKL